jgi:hypothetical protein
MTGGGGERGGIISCLATPKDCALRRLPVGPGNVCGAGNESLAVFLTGPVGLLVHLASRLSGMLTVCGRCHNKRLDYALRCPHCGQTADAG